MRGVNLGGDGMNGCGALILAAMGGLFCILGHRCGIEWVRIGSGLGARLFDPAAIFGDAHPYKGNGINQGCRIF